MAAAIECDMSFLDRRPVGKVRLFLNLPDGSHHVLLNLNLPQVAFQGSLLNFAFECPTNGTPTADLHVPSIAAGIGLVRFIYTQNYAWPSSQDDVPLLMTAHLFALGYQVDYEELYHSAHLTLLRNVNYAVYSPSAPFDLCTTIRFLWTQTWATTKLSAIKGDILRYCVTAFEKHNLGSNPEFIKLSEELVNFVADLSKTNSERHFEQVGIMQLPGPNRHPHRPLEEDFYIACVFSSHCDEDSIYPDNDTHSRDGTISEDGEDDCEDFCANDAVPGDDEGDGEDLSRANDTIADDEKEGEGKDSSSTVDNVSEAGEADGEDFRTNGTISEDEEVYSEVSFSIDVVSEGDEEGEGEDFSSTDGEDFSSTDGKDFSRTDGEDFSRANGIVSEGEDDENDEQPASRFHLPMRPKPTSQASTDLATALTSPTSESSFVLVGDSVQSTISESSSESEWQVL